MTQILAPQATSTMLHGLYYKNGIFLNRYGLNVSNEWAKYLIWTNANSRHGDKFANMELEKFCKQYNIKP
jgi:hypothetical protein